MVLGSKIFLWVISLLSIVAFIGVILCIAIPVWDEITVDVTVSRVITTHTYSGIWSVCTLEEVKDHSTFDCDKNPDDSALDAARAMLLIGAIMCGGAVVLIFLKGCCFKDNKIISYVIVVLCFASAVFLVIGAIIFSEEVSASSAEMTAGFIICILAAILIAVVGALMVILLCCCNDRDD